MTLLSTFNKHWQTNIQALTNIDPAAGDLQQYQAGNPEINQSNIPMTVTARQAFPSGQEARMAAETPDLKDNQMLLTHKEGELYNFFNVLPFSMVMVSLDGTIQQANEAFSQLTGFSRDELHTKVIDELFSAREYAGTDFSFIKHLLNNENAAHEKRLLTKEGNTLYVLIKALVNRNHAGLPQQVLLQVADITERKEFEELLQKRNEALEKANKELDRFVYSTSHDLRAPLRSILGLIFIMQSETDPATQKTYLEMMRSSVNRMDAFIKEIVELSKNSMQDVKLEPVEIKPLVSEIFESLRYIPGAEKIHFSVAVKQDTKFCSDVSRLKIILNNLIANAVTYHNLNQEHPFISVQVSVKDKFADIDVIDNGRGIKKEHQEKIFDMFYRASEDTKGSGLGLFIVKEAVSKLKGSIRLKSKWATGTKFSVKILNNCN